jgi:murein DD-endopeptidase MepM/ murein hydrolase activator NlpD/SH3-like domain-containing protein
MFTISNKSVLCLIVISLFLGACSKLSGPGALFKKTSPHDDYTQSLKRAGLENTVLGKEWLTSSENAITRALTITIPYKEIGYFAPEKAQVATYKFNAARGQEIHVSLQKRPVVNFNIYIDLFAQQTDGEPKRVAYADTLGRTLDYEIDKAGLYYLRLQPELLSGGEYTLTITAGPSLSFPVSSSGKPRIGSYWGDNRDEGGRRHEGIDIFATKGTPAIAAANGTVTGVTENKLGGKVVFMRPDEKDYALYYAHLDAQLVQSGQQVHIGDTLGLVGNTGNAQYTPSHLHFGIYTNAGAIDPIKFVDRDVKTPQAISAPLTMLNATGRVKIRGTLFNTPSANNTIKTSITANTPVQIHGATGNWFKVTLPDGQEGYVDDKMITKATALKDLTLKSRQIVYSAPDSINAVRKGAIIPQSKVSLLGTYKSYSLVTNSNVTGWIADSK